MPLELRLFGEFRLRLDQRPEPVEVSHRLRLLIGYLGLCPGQHVSRAQIAFDLWPESTDAQAHTNLRQLVHRLQSALPALRRHLQVSTTQLALSGDRVTIDVAAFDRAATEADQAFAAGDVAAARTRYREAEAHYLGDLLPGHEGGWLEEARERYWQRYGHVLERLVSASEALGELDEAARHAERLVRHDPLSEANYRTLMRLYVVLGDRPKALHAYHRCVRVLERELDVTPDAATSALYDSVRRHETAGVEVDADALLVGRDGALRELEAAWRSAQRAGPRLVVLSGDPGIGKSRLVEAFTARHRSDGTTLHLVRSFASDAGLPLSTLARCLTPDLLARAGRRLAPVWLKEVARAASDTGATVAPDPASPITEPWQRRRLFEALARTLLLTQPTLLIVEDAQWCDQESLEWLRFALRTERHVRLLVVVSVRSGDVRDVAPLEAMRLQAARDGRLDALELEPLDLAGTVTLAERLLGRRLDATAARRLFERTEGNPLFIEETVRAGGLDTPDATVPLRLQATLRQRLTVLDDQARDLLEHAAVIGRSFTFDLLHAASGRREEELVADLDRLWRRRLIRTAPAGGYDFAHEHLREVVYADISPARRQLLHRRLAQTLEQRGGGLEAAVIASHHERGGSLEAAVASIIVAARHAADLYALGDATSLVERGLALLSRREGEAALQPWWRHAHSELHELVGDLRARLEQREAAREAYQTALEHLANEPVRRADLLRKTSAVLVNDGRVPQALAELEAATACLGDEAERSERAWRVWLDVQAETTRALYFAGDEAWEHAERIVQAMAPVVTRVGTAQQRIAFAQSVLRVGLRQRGFAADDGLLHHARSLLAAAQEIGDVDAIADARFRLGFVQLFADDLPAARPQLLGALEDARATANALLTVRCLAYACVAMRRQGDPVALATRAHQLREAARAGRHDSYVSMHHAHVAYLARCRGDWQATTANAEAALEGWQALDFPLRWLAVMPWLAAQAHADDDRSDDAARVLRERIALVLAADQQRLPAAVEARCRAALEADRIDGAVLSGIVAAAEDAGYA